MVPVIVRDFWDLSPAAERADLSDSISVDAKRILLRYGAPIAVLDNVTDEHRVEFARVIARTTLPDRESRVRELLIEHAYIVVEQD